MDNEFHIQECLLQNKIDEITSKYRQLFLRILYLKILATCEERFSISTFQLCKN